MEDQAQWMETKRPQESSRVEAHASSASNSPPKKRSKTNTSDEEDNSRETGGDSNEGLEEDEEDEEDSNEELKAASFRWWLIQQRQSGVPPEEVLQKLGLTYNGYPVENEEEKTRTETELWNKIIKMGIQLLSPSAPPRRKMKHINTLPDAIQLLKQSSNIVLLIGAGISVSCGIPDFRSEDGIYNQLEKYNLPNPQCMFASEGFSYIPSKSHYFIKLLEEKGKLLRCYSQNIDMLEDAAGISDEKAMLCHGSFATATCMDCNRKFPGSDIRSDIAAQRIPTCATCTGVIKPDITFFGESLSERFHDLIHQDQTQADLLIVIGSSLKVNPVRSIISTMPDEVPMILINREKAGEPHEFDIELLGFCDPIISHLCQALEWDIPSPPQSLVDRALHRQKDSSSAEAKQESGVETPGGETCAASERKPAGVTLARQSSSEEPKSVSIEFEFVPPATFLFKGAIRPSRSQEDPEEDSEEEGQTEAKMSTTGEKVVNTN